MDQKFDCIIVGAGPAGSMAAKTLAESGMSVLLLEKHPRIGVPLACAEAISCSGLDRFVDPDPEWICTRIHRVLLVSPSNRKLIIRHPRAGFVLDRKIFDRRLAEKASTLGAEVKVNCPAVGLLNHRHDGFAGVRVLENGKEKEYSAKAIIGADGVESWVARWAGIDSSVTLGQIESCAQSLVAEVDVEEDRMEFYLGKSVAPGGYAWVFPKGKGIANVGLAVTPDRTPKKAREFLDEFLQKRFSDFRVIESTMGGVPAFDRKKGLVRKNVLLVGDAGRLLDSLSGAGISNALLSGRIAGEVTSRFIKEGGTSFSGLQGYEERILKEKGSELRFYSYSRAVFLKLTDEDMDAAVDFLGDYFGDRVITGIEPIALIKAILKSNRRMLRLLRRLVW
jgi:digeranylgeranylglycerophospholipid reductase